MHLGLSICVIMSSRVLEVRHTWKDRIYSVVVKGINGLPSLDPFNAFKDIDHLVENVYMKTMITHDKSNLDERQ